MFAQPLEPVLLRAVCTHVHGLWKTLGTRLLSFILAARKEQKGEKEKKIGLPSHGPRVTSNLAHIISPDSTPVHLTIVLYLLPSLLFHSPFSTRTFSDIRVVVNRRSSCTKRAYTLFVIPLTVSRFLSFFLSRVENRAAVSSELSLSLSLSLCLCLFLFLLYSVSSRLSVSALCLL